jgi:hypothetical protein
MTRFGEVPRSPTLADQGPPNQSAETPVPLPRRGRVAGSGFVERVTILPRNDPPQFSATVALHTARPATGSEAAHPANRVRLVWTGQRRIPGIDPGIELAFEGMVSLVDGTPTIHNPRYEIVGRPEESP